MTTAHVPIGRHAERAAQRLKTFERTTIRAHGLTAVAHILNISEIGAQVHSTAVIDPPVDVRLMIADREVRGSAIWSREGRVGIRFFERLAPHDINALLK